MLSSAPLCCSLSVVFYTAHYSPPPQGGLGALPGRLGQESAGPQPRSQPHLWELDGNKVCECPSGSQPSKQVTVTVLGVFLGKVFQVPFGELLLREHNDYVREGFSVNNIPQVFQLLYPSLWMTVLVSRIKSPFSGWCVSQEDPRCQPSCFQMLWGHKGHQHREHTKSSHCFLNSFPPLQYQLGFTKQESGAQRGE